MEQIKSAIEKLSFDPYNPELNLLCAKEYYAIKQTGAAVSFYLRAAEYGYETHQEIVYAALLKIAQCFSEQSGREHTVINTLMQAAAYLPGRPEAYFLISRYHERNARWQECYTWAEIGLHFADLNLDNLLDDVEYYGKYCLEFEKAISSWWIGRIDEAYHFLSELNKNDNIKEEYKQAILKNMERIGLIN